MNEQSITPSTSAPCREEMGGSRIAIFPGSFDPFTIGHADIVRRGLQLFDRVVVAIGYNAQKAAAQNHQASVEERVAAVARIYIDEPRVKVVSYSGLTADLAAQEGARFLLRGVRSVKDFEYERDLAAVNAMIPPALRTEGAECRASNSSAMCGVPAPPIRGAVGVETVLLIADPRYAHISSSVVRELKAYGRDVTPYLP